MKHYWADDASRTGNKEMSQVSSPAGGLWCPLWAARVQIPHEVGIWNPLLIPSVLGAEVRQCQAVQWRSSWHLQCSTWLQGAEAGAAQTWLCFPGSCTGHSSSCPAGTSFFLSWKPKSGSGRHWQTLADTGILDSIEPLTCFLHGANAWRTP